VALLKGTACAAATAVEKEGFSTFLLRFMEISVLMYAKCGHYPVMSSTRNTQQQLASRSNDIRDSNPSNNINPPDEPPLFPETKTALIPACSL